MAMRIAAAVHKEYSNAAWQRASLPYLAYKSSTMQIQQKSHRGHSSHQKVDGLAGSLEVRDLQATRAAQRMLVWSGTEAAVECSKGEQLVQPPFSDI